ncbi:MAG: hypothetical protein ACOVRP_11970, partial [Gemmatimonas sp.]
QGGIGTARWKTKFDGHLTPGTLEHAMTRARRWFGLGFGDALDAGAELEGWGRQAGGRCPRAGQASGTSGGRGAGRRQG